MAKLRPDLISSTALAKKPKTTKERTRTAIKRERMVQPQARKFLQSNQKDKSQQNREKTKKKSKTLKRSRRTMRTKMSKTRLTLILTRKRVRSSRLMGKFKTRAGRKKSLRNRTKKRVQKPKTQWKNRTKSLRLKKRVMKQKRSKMMLPVKVATLMHRTKKWRKKIQQANTKLNKKAKRQNPKRSFKSQLNQWS